MKMNSELKVTQTDHSPLPKISGNSRKGITKVKTYCVEVCVCVMLHMFIISK